MRCIKCQAQAVSGARFCHECGAAIESASPPIPPETISSDLTKLILLIVVGIVVSIVAFYLSGTWPHELLFQPGLPVGFWAGLVFASLVNIFYFWAKSKLWSAGIRTSWWVGPGDTAKLFRRYRETAAKLGWSLLPERGFRISAAGFMTCWLWIGAEVGGLQGLIWAIFGVLFVVLVERYAGRRT